MNLRLFYFINLFLIRCAACYELDLNMFNYWAKRVCDNMSPLWSQVIIGISDGEVVVSAAGNTLQYDDFTGYTSSGMSNHGVPIAARYDFPTNMVNDTNISMTVISTCPQGSYTNLTQAEFDSFGLSMALMQVPIGYGNTEPDASTEARPSKHQKSDRRATPQFIDKPITPSVIR